jgi:hypothetical protein
VKLTIAISNLQFLGVVGLAVDSRPVLWGKPNFILLVRHCESETSARIDISVEYFCDRIAVPSDDAHRGVFCFK